MNISEFKLERYFARHEFVAKHLLSSSDCDGYELKYVLAHASKHELDLWEGMKLGYTESEGSSVLRESILQYYKLKTIENVVVASPGELNFISMNVFLKPGDHVITVSPSYQSLYEVVKSINCTLSYWEPNPDTWEFNPEDLKKLIKSNTRLIIINFPHNPTGSYLTRSQLDEIVALAKQHDLYLFSDEMYWKLTNDESEELPPVCDLYEKGISLWGTSKSLGLAGLRIGWLVAQDTEFLRRVCAFKDYLSICNSAPSEVLSIIALNHSSEFLQPNLEKIKTNVLLFAQFAKEHEFIASFVPPKAGSTAFVKLNLKNTSLEFSNRLVQEAGIMTVPAEMFEYPGRYIRIGFGRRSFPEVLEAFDRYLRKAKLH